MKVVKTLLWITLGLFVSATVAVIGFVVYEKNAHRLWSPKDIELGFTLNDHKSEVYFRLGKPDEPCESLKGDGPDLQMCQWDNQGAAMIVVFDEQDRVNRILAHLGYRPGMTPLTDETRVLQAMGEPLIKTVESGLTSRSYCYPEQNWCAILDRGSVSAMLITQVEWGQPFKTLAQYHVAGEQICPSAKCPFDEQGEVLPQYKGQSYKIFSATQR